LLCQFGGAFSHPAFQFRVVSSPIGVWFSFLARHMV
jgi:hypothetical protein